MRIFIAITCIFCLSSCAFLGVQSVGIGGVDVRDSESVAYFEKMPDVTYLLRAKDAKYVSRRLVERQYTEDDVVFGLAVTGGGARAAGYTLGVLQGLSEIKDPDDPTRSALEAIDFTSSTSGGTWGIVAYLGDRLSINDDACDDYDLGQRRHEISRVLAKTTKTGGFASRRMRRFIEDLGRGKTFNDTGKHCLFDPYINATISNSVSPFVFTQDYFDNFKIRKILSPGEPDQCETDSGGKNDCDYLSTMWIGDLELGKAAFISGAVPGWYHAKAITNLCEDSPIAQTYHCTEKDRGWVRLVDGGLYDNYGYRAAFQILDGARLKSEERRFLIQVDNTTNLPYVTNPSANDRLEPIRLLRSMSFATQDAIFKESFGALGELSNTETLVLDFHQLRDCYRCIGDSEYLEGLDALKDYALSFQVDETVDPLPTDDEPIFGEEYRNHYWRAAMSTGVTFKFHYNEDYDRTKNAGKGTIAWQIGILVARLNAEEVSCGVFNKLPNGETCDITYSREDWLESIDRLQEELDQKKGTLEGLEIAEELAINLYRFGYRHEDFHYVQRANILFIALHQHYEAAGDEENRARINNKLGIYMNGEVPAQRFGGD